MKLSKALELQEQAEGLTDNLKLLHKLKQVTTSGDVWHEFVQVVWQGKYPNAVPFRYAKANLYQLEKLFKGVKIYD